MNCPFCGSNQVDVVNSRPTSPNQFWRRRLCRSCDKSYTTYERIDLSYMVVEKKSGKRQKYNRGKLYSSIYHPATNKKNSDRGDVSQFTQEVMYEVETVILNKYKKTISSKEIEDIVLAVLFKKSKAGMLSYLAYRESDDEKKLARLIRKFIS